VAQEHVFIVFSLIAEAALRVRDVNEVCCVWECLSYIINLAVFYVELLYNRSRFRILLICSIYKSVFIKFDFPVVYHSLSIFIK